jgi:hypothetical protein
MAARYPIRGPRRKRGLSFPGAEWVAPTSWRTHIRLVHFNPIVTFPAAVLAAVLAALLMVAAPRAHAKPQVMILGTYHMHNPKMDVLKHEIRDTLSPERQKEILTLVASLKRFQPTRIAVESDPRTSKRQEEFAAYVAGRRVLTANEIDQLGFRIAKDLGHPDLCLFDHQGPYPYPAVHEWLKKQGVDVDAGLGQRQRRAEQADRVFTVGQKLAIANSDEDLRLAHWRELKSIDAGDPVDGPGPNLVAAWYERNLRMFARLRACPRSNEERLLVIVGAGHAKLLRDFVRDSPDLDFVSPLAYLPPPPRIDRAPARSIRAYPPRASTPPQGGASLLEK